MASRIPLRMPPSRLAYPFQPFRARPTWGKIVTGPLSARRYAATDIGENKTGHIRAGPNEGILFVDDIFPGGSQWLVRFLGRIFNVESSIPRMLAKVKGERANTMDPMHLVQQALPKGLPINVTEVIPRVKEGGVFVKFAHDPSVELSELEGTIRRYLKENPVRPLLSPFTRVKAFLVRGSPWLEDLQRWPSPKLRVDFLSTEVSDGKELPQEVLYGLFRKFGKIRDIQPQPADSKVLPKYATIYFNHPRDAIMARNCLHGFILPKNIADGKYAGTMIKMTYESLVKAHIVRDWIRDHPRVVFPILVAIAAGITVAIFDPIRTFFVKAHIERSFHIDDSKFYQWVLRRIRSVNIFSKHLKDENMKTILSDRKADIDKIRSWLMESTDTFIVVQGPRGAGKKELVVGEALRDRKITLVIDCKPIQEGRGDSGTINAAANEVGYRPVFSWMNSISSLLDLAAQGTIGTKTGFSETLDTQLAKIWSTTAVALKQIALRDRDKDPKDKGMGDDEYLEAHPEKRPVVVVDNFLHKSQENNVVYDKIAEWAADLTTANIAHVIFLTTDVSFSKSLSNALPDRVFRTITLGDCTPDVAKKYVLDHMKSGTEQNKTEGGDENSVVTVRRDLDELDSCIALLGGRLTDLEFLARRITSGDSPKHAVHEIIEQSASEILKMFVLDVDSSKRPWTPTQTWYLINMLADNDQIRYNETLLSDTFKSNESVLRALEQAEMISITSANGRPVSIRPGKPVYRSAFQYLTRDRVLKARLELIGLDGTLKSASADIEKCEQELTVLGSLPKQPRELTARVKYLLDKLQASQAKIEAAEKKQTELKKVLAEQY